MAVILFRVLEPSAYSSTSLLVPSVELSSSTINYYYFYLDPCFQVIRYLVKQVQNRDSFFLRIMMEGIIIITVTHIIIQFR